MKKHGKVYSLVTKAEIGPNNGKKYSIDEKIFIKEENLIEIKKILDFKKSFNNVVRVIKGTNFNYFSEKAKNIFFKESYSVTGAVDRMGMRLDGTNLENIVNTNNNQKV